MAKSDAFMIFHVNTADENKKLLQESRHKNQVEQKSKEDLQKLYSKLNRNSQIKSPKDEGHLNPSWYNKNVTNYTYGPVHGFPTGSWWGIRMDCSRDRVHDPFDEDIHNGPFGVTSICTSSANTNEDVDLGNDVTLTGQKYTGGKSDKDPLIKNYENQVPVRLIRSYNLLNEFAPKTGYRYDGMYCVKDFWIGVNSDSAKYYKFILTRLSDQEPPPWSTEQILLAPNKSVPCSVPKPIKSSECLFNMYEFKKYSHGPNNIIRNGKSVKTKEVAQSSDTDGKGIEKPKNVSESSIVTRHVFKKTNTNAECTTVPCTPFASDVKSLSHVRTQASKTHSTNISIRTGLYDSSHSVQQDLRKNTSIPFCRISKSVNTLKPNLHIKLESSKMKAASQDASKESTTVANGTDFDSKCSCSIPHCKHEFHNNKTNENVKTEGKGMLRNNVSSSGIVVSTSKLCNSELECNTALHDNMSEDIQELKELDSLESLTPDKILHLISQETCHPLSKLLMGNMIGLTSEQSIALKMQDSSVSQPEVKEQSRNQNSSTEENTEKKNFKVLSEDVIGARCYKFRRRKRLSRKMLNKSEVGRCDKITSNKLQKNSAQSVNMLEKNLTLINAYDGSQVEVKKEDTLYSSKRNKNVKAMLRKRSDMQKINISSTQSAKKTSESRNEIRTRLRAAKAIKSGVKKHIHKKKRREIANLSIDAKISPKIRGPRNRRLRCINNVYKKRSYEPFSTAISALNKCKLNSEIPEQQTTNVFKNRNTLTKVTRYKRITTKETRNVKESDRLNMKQNETHKSDIAINQNYKKVGKDLIAEEDVSNNNDDDEDIDSNKGSKTSKNIAKIIQTSDAMPSKSRKRKTIQRIPAEPKYHNSIEDRRNYNRKILKPCRIDAITQCSLIKEPLTINSRDGASSDDCTPSGGHKEHYTFIKIEYNDPKDMKFEANEAVLTDDETGISTETSKHCGETERRNSTPLFNRDNLEIEKEQSTMERTSAFVPVNPLDSDLRIARLRSIGFRPIMFQPCGNVDEQSEGQGKKKCSVACTSKVLEQDVAEKYNKYANEEDNIVVYMDDELQYQDIEDEDETFVVKKYRASIQNISDSTDEQSEKEHLEGDSRDDLSLEQDVESPWHGWKKVVTSKESYWIGW